MIVRSDAWDLVQLLTRTANAIELPYGESDVIFAQGDVSDSIFYLGRGRIKCSILSSHGKTGVVAILKAGQFFGEECLIGHATRVMTATAMTPCSVTRIEKSAMVRMLYERLDLAEKFISFLIDQSLQYKDQLVNHLFNSSEKRLARTLLVLSDGAKEDGQEAIIPNITQETLAEIVGTTRSRINHFMNKFRRLGLIQYDGTIRVRRALISNMLLEDDEPDSN